MSDDKIVELYWRREEKAIEYTDEKYGRYLYTIAYNIVHNRPDCEECLNDTYLGTWNCIPPTRPKSFQAFISKIMRNVAVNKFRRNNADKRIPSSMTVSLEEMEDCVAYNSSVDEEYAIRELTRILNKYLSELPEREATIFISRYYYSDSLEELSEMLGVSERTVSRILLKLRQDLKQLLDEEGYGRE
jgi:RNA polymerase sigma-70 factor (ECF subfamily)